jgi:hypothetical protein
VSKRSRRARSASQPASQPGNRPVNKPATPSGTPSATPSATAAEATASGASTARPATARPASVRAGRRERARPYAQQKSFFERYRILIIGLVGVAAVALLAVWAFNSASAAAFTCSTEWVPEPTASPAPGAAPQPGYHQEGMGNTHVGPGTNNPGDVTYTYCPPASGNHFVRGGPITPGFHGPDDVPLPQGWVHNLEHGALVVLYRGDPGDPGLTSETQQQMQAFFSGLGPSPVCGFPPTQEGAGVVIARFDQMATPFAAMVWERVLPLDTFDEDAISEFWTTWGERTNPEQLCTPPSPAPASPAPS